MGGNDKGSLGRSIPPALNYLGSNGGSRGAPGQRRIKFSPQAAPGSRARWGLTNPLRKGEPSAIRRRQPACNIRDGRKINLYLARASGFVRQCPPPAERWAMTDSRASKR